MIEVEVEGVGILEFPDGTPDDVINQAVQRELGQDRELLQQRETFTFEDQPAETPGMLEGGMQSLLKGATLGFSDEIQSLIAAAVASPVVSDKTFGQLMVDARKSFRDEQAKFEQENPKTAFGLEIAGGLATGGAATAGKGVIGSAATGAALGGIAGAGLADAEDFASTETAASAGTGAVIGAGVGAALPVLGSIAKSGARGLVDGVKSLFPVPKGVQQKFVQQVQAGNVDDDLARYIIEGSGKVAKDPLYNEAVKQGFEPGAIAAIKGASASDKKKMLDMVNIIKKGRKNSNFARLNRPGDVAGDTLIERINFVKGVNKKAGQEIDRVAKGLRGKAVDIGGALDDFGQQLDTLGVDLVENAKTGKITPDFENSILSRGDRAPVKEVIRQVMRITNKGTPDAFDAHQLKRAIDNNVTYGKSTSLTRDAESLLKGLRANIDSALDETFPEYDQANTIFRETIESLDLVRAETGRKIDLTSDNVDKQLGTLLRRLMGNQQSRVALYDAVQSIEDTAKKYGGQFDDSTTAQAFFVDELENVFGASTQTGFRSEITKGIRDAVRGQRTAVGAASEAAGAAAEKVLETVEGVSEDAAFDVIEKMLAR